MSRSRLAWGLATADVVAFIGAMVVNPSDLSVVLYAVGITSFAGVGAVLISRVPANPIGALLLAAGTVLVAGIVIGSYADVGAAQQPPWPGSTLARSLGNLLFFYPFVIAFIGVPLVFPDGRLLSPRFRWVVVFAIANTIAWTMGGLSIANLDAFVLVGTLFTFGGAMVAIGLRYRRGDPIQRQQIKWLAADVGLAIAALIPALLLAESYAALADAFSSLAILAMLAMPLVIGIAVLRYRLYEIDRIVSRTIAYAVVTVVLAAVFGGVVVLSSTALSQVAQGQTIAVAASTLAVFAIFQPVLRRVRHAVDRRFNRARYDAERTIASFSERLRDEVDITTVTKDLLDTVDSAIGPSSSGLWIRGAERP